MVFKSCIVDELGHFMIWCSDISEEEKERILAQYPECRVEAWQVDCIC